MKEFIGTLFGGIVIAGFISLFVSTMNQTQTTSGTDAGNLWVLAMGLIIVFLAIMSGWHRIFS